MNEELVSIYETETLMEAQLVCDRLEETGIGSSIDNTESPLDGLAAAQQMVIVRVGRRDAERAAEILSQFRAEHAEDFDSGADTNLNEDE